MRSTRPTRGSRRWVGLMTLALMAGALIPAALAMACNPQAYLTLDKSQYAPGSSVSVAGSFFRGDTNITVSIDRIGSSTVKTAANGSFKTTFAIPAGAASGGYTVSAIGYEANGDVINGLPARASFSVAQPAPQPAAPQPVEPSTPAASSPQASQPSAPTAQPAAGQPSAPQASRPTQARPTAPSTSASGFREPKVITEPNVRSSRPTATTTRRSTSGGATANADRATVGGRTVFGGSVAPVISTPAPAVAAVTPRSSATRPTGGTRTASPSAAVGPQAAERTATDDVWGALNSDRTPSVLPAAGDGVAVSSPRNGSQMTLGLLLLGGGVLALAGGLAAGEARRRRVRAR